MADPHKAYSLTSDDLAAINPNTLTCPIVRSGTDARILQKIYRRLKVIARDRPAENPYTIRWRQGLFNLTSDSALFHTRESLEAAGWQLVGNRFRRAGQTMLPLTEAKHIGQFTHRAACFKNVDGAKRFGTHATASRSTPEQLQDPCFVPLPRYWVLGTQVQQRMPSDQWVVGFRRVISNVSDSRSLIAAVIPFAGIGNTLPIIWSNLDKSGVGLLLAALNSMVVDYVLRQKASGDVNFFTFKQLPVLPPSYFEHAAAWSLQSLRQWVLDRVVELTYTAWDLAAFAKDCGYQGPPFRWNEERRFQLRCELDAAYFCCYGINRDEVAHIIETFPILCRRDQVQYHGLMRTKVTILEIYDQLTKASSTGKTYRSPLDPPPGPPAGPLPDWEAGPQPTFWPTHLHAPSQPAEAAPSPQVFCQEP